MASRLPLQPQPDGWISVAKPPKQPTQRPLVKLDANVHHGISTPPSSTRRKRSAPASNLTASQSKRTRSTQQQATPTTALNRRLDSYLTPPTTTGKETRRRKPLDSVPQNVPSDESITQFLNEPPIRPSSKERTQPPAEKPTRPLRSTPQQQANVGPRTPEQASLSQRELTQVPSSVLARHQRLCGQDSVRRRATRSPWRKVTEEDEAAELEERRADRQRRAEEMEREKERRRLRLDVRDSVERQAQERIEGAKQKRALGMFKSLVQLSSDSSSSPHSSSPSRSGSDGSKSRNLRPYSSAIEEPVCERETNWPRPHVVPSSRLATMPMQRRTPPLKVDVDLSRDDSPSPSKSSPPGRSVRSRGQISPVRKSKSPVRKSKSPVRKPRSPVRKSRLPAVTTPKKPKRPHHQVTPPKSRTPQGNQPETLFVFPLPKPPPQPVFVPAPRPFTEWRPVEMEAETLMTWSLGGGGASVDRNVDLPPSDPPVDFDQVQPVGSLRDLPPSDPPALPSSEPPALPPSDPPRDSDDTDSVSCFESDWADNSQIAPSVPSQTFPELIQSSPARPKSSPARQDRGFPMLTSPARLPRLSISPGKRLVRRSGSPKRVNEAIFASLGDDTPKAKPPPPSQKRPAKRPSPKHSQKDPQQTKLNIFGYFPKKEKKAEEFDVAFSDEEDLDFGDDDLNWTPRPAAAPGLARVPEAPPHPSLREAGRRELAKRDAEAMERHRSQQRPPSTPQTDSSSLTPDDGPQTSESMRRWFAQLGQSSSEPSSDL